MEKMQTFLWAYLKKKKKKLSFEILKIAHIPVCMQRKVRDFSRAYRKRKEQKKQNSAYIPVCI